MDIILAKLTDDSLSGVSNSKRLADLAVSLMEDVIGSRQEGYLSTIENQRYTSVRDLLFMKYVMIDYEAYKTNINKYNNLYGDI